LRQRRGALRLELQRSLELELGRIRLARCAQRAPAQLVEEGLFRMGRECGLGRLQRFPRPIGGDEVLHQGIERGTVARTGQVEAGGADHLGSVAGSAARRSDGGDLGQCHTPETRHRVETVGRPLQNLLRPAALGEADDLHQHLRVAGILALVALQRRHRLPIEAEGFEQPQQTEHRVPVRQVVADRLAVFLHGPLEVAELLGRGSRQPARTTVVRPQAQPLVECLERLGGLAARQQQAPPQQVLHDRRGFELGNQLLRLVVIAAADQQIDVGGHQRGRRLVHQLHARGQRISGLGRLATPVVVLRQREPGLGIVAAVAEGGPAEQLLGFVGLPRCCQVVRESFDVGQMGRLRLVGAAQDLQHARVVRSLGEELDRLGHHELLARKPRQAILPGRLGRLGLALLLREGGPARTESRVPRALGGQVLDRCLERGERLLGLLGAIEGEESPQAPHQGLRVVGLQGQHERRGFQGLLVLSCFHSGLEEKAGHIGPIRRELEHPEHLLHGVGGAASTEQRSAQQQSVLDGPVGLLRGLAQRPDRELRSPHAQ
jgi:hypothetical protein